MNRNLGPDRIEERRIAYQKCAGKPLGTLHQRMKYLRQMVDSKVGPPIAEEWVQIVHAVRDLEIEASYYKAMAPPYGRRIKKAAPHI